MPPRPIPALLGLLLLLPALAGCPSTPEPPVVAGGALAPEEEGPLLVPAEVPDQRLDDPNRIVARVNDQIITYRSLQAEYGEALAALGEEDPEIVEAVLQNYALRLIQLRLLAEAAERMGLSISREDLEMIAAAEAEEAKKRGVTLEEDLIARGVARWEWEEEQARILKIRRFLAVALGDVNVPVPEYRPWEDTYVRPADVRSYYDRNPGEFQEIEQARVAAIFVRLKDYAQDGEHESATVERAGKVAGSIVARARAGEDFDRLVAEFHEEPLGAFSEPFRRGDRKGDEVEEFAWSAKAGDVSEPMFRRSGFLVLKLVERTENRLVPFEEARPRLEEYLGGLRRDAAHIQLQTALLRDAVVEPARLKQALNERLRADLARVLEALSK